MNSQVNVLSEITGKWDKNRFPSRTGPSDKIRSMARDFFDPSPEQQVVILVESTVLRQAERLIESCEYCNEEGAEIPFDNIFDRVTE